MARQASAKYYQKKQRKDSKKKSRERHQNLSEEGKNKKREYGRGHHKNLSEDEKQKLVEYRKGITKSTERTERSLDKVSVSRYKSKNGLILERPRLQFLATRVAENEANLGQPDAFEIKYIEFLY